MTFKEAVRASIKGDVNAFENVQINNLRAYDLSQLCIAFAVWRSTPTLVCAINVCAKYHNIYKYHLPSFKHLSTVPGMDNWDRDPARPSHACVQHDASRPHRVQLLDGALPAFRGC